MTTSPKTVPIAEVFGPTLQGEGALAGKPTHFVRVGGCDYACDWCDSGFAVNAAEVRALPKLTMEQIFERLTELPAGPEWLTISGGNPALYDLTELAKFWQAHNAFGQVAAETQGSKWADWFKELDLLTVSPKGPSSGMDPVVSLKNFRAFKRKLYENMPMKAEIVVKVVVFDEADYEFAGDVQQAAEGAYPMFLSVGTAMGGLTGQWVPPAVDAKWFDKFNHLRGRQDFSGWNLRAFTDDFQSHQRRWRWLADRMKGDPAMADVALFPQLHALIWGFDERGV